MQKISSSGFKREVWAIGGGKGGVGKSIITANIALALANKGHRVVLLDADFGSSNLHTYLGMKSPQNTLFDFICEQQTKIQDYIAETPYKNVFLLGGGEDSLKVSNLRTYQTDKLNRSLQQIDADYIVIDLGAGTTLQTIETFIRSDKGILVTMPEPASVENTYRFIKYSILRKVHSLIHDPKVRNFLSQAMSHKVNSNQQNTAAILQQIERINEESAEKIRRSLQTFNLKLILNQVQNNNDVRLGFSISSSCQKYFGIRLDYTGFIEADEQIQKSSRSRLPVLKLQPFAKSSRGIKKIAENLETNSQMMTPMI